jgi:transposase
MRGHADDQLPLFHVFCVEDRIRPDHPLRDIKRRVDRILEGMSAAFDAAYSRTGRPSVPPERLLKALLLMALYSVRSERQLCERIDTDLLFRWFLDLRPSDDAFDATTFTHNRSRLDGTLIESLASAKSFRPREADDGDPSDGHGFKPRNAAVDFHGQKRTNETHVSRTDPEARLYRKSGGPEARLSHMGHLLTENRHGIIVAVAATEASGTAERAAAVAMLDDLASTHARRPATLGADKGFDDGEFFRTLEARAVVPHVPLVKEPRDPRTVAYKRQVPGVRARRRMKRRMRTAGYRLSQRCRKKLEEGFGWLKTVAGLDRCRTVGRWKLRQLLEVGAAAYNLVRMRTLAPAA